MPPKYTHIYLTHNGAEMWSYTTDVEEGICLIVVFISSGHPAFSVPKAPVEFMTSSSGYTASFWDAYFPFNHIQRL